MRGDSSPANPAGRRKEEFENVKFGEREKREGYFVALLSFEKKRERERENLLLRMIHCQ